METARDSEPDSHHLLSSSGCRTWMPSKGNCSSLKTLSLLLEIASLTGDNSLALGSSHCNREDLGLALEDS